jgi:hypothetical protein
LLGLFRLVFSLLIGFRGVLTVVFGCLGAIIYSVVTAIEHDSSMTIDREVVQE